jgi:dipeptide/tripeptide permease
MPKGVPYIIGNEFAERFSFYGMRSIVVVFMTGYLLNRNGQLDVMTHCLVAVFRLRLSDRRRSDGLGNWS